MQLESKITLSEADIGSRALTDSKDIELVFGACELNKEKKKYLQYHSKRYEYLLKKIREFRKLIKAKRVRLMDIGPSYFSFILCASFPEDEVRTMGLAASENRGGHCPDELEFKNSFIHYDLNNAQSLERWISVPSCHIVVLAEVIEHLHTAPSLILRFVYSFMVEGGILIIQTPNAVSLYKRLMMLCGYNPYHMIDENINNPRHFREYTKAELVEISVQSGFEVLSCEFHNYFNYSLINRYGRLYGVVRSLLTSSFWDGITLVLRKPSMAHKE